MDNPNPRITDINIRTMESDQKSIAEQGGGEPKPYVPPVVPTAVSPQINQEPMPSAGAKDWGQIPPASPLPAMPTGRQAMPVGERTMPPHDGMTPPKPLKAPKKKTFLPLVLVVVILVGAGAALYLLFPSLFRLAGPVVPEVSGPEIETPFEEPIVPVVETGEPLPETEEVTLPTGIPATDHLSLFGVPPDSTEEVTLTAIAPGSAFRGALALSPTQVPLFREVILQDADGNLIPFDEVIATFAPNAFGSAEAREAFQPDATYYTYTDARGTWFGLAAKFKTDADRGTAQAAVRGLESVETDIRNFYLSDVTPSADGLVFKDGKVGDVTTRYAMFAEESAAFNYGWSGDTLLLGTSYQAFSEAERRL